MASLQLPGRLHAGDPEPDLSAYRVQFTYRTPTAPADDEQPEALVDVAATATTSADGSFTLTLPAKEDVRPPMTATAFAPGGDAVGRRDLGADLPDTLAIAVEAEAPVVLQGTDDPLKGRQVKLLGRVLEATGQRQIATTQVVVMGIRAQGDAPAPLLAATTDPSGYFAGPYPADELTEAFGRVGIGAGIDVPIPLQDGRLPQRVLLMVDVREHDEHAGTGEPHDDCSCHADVPRAPDQEELTSSPGTFSSDLGGGRCVDFSTPNRTLEEHSFFTVVRTTEPVIKGFTLDTPGKLPPRIRDHIRELLEPVRVMPAMTTRAVHLDRELPAVAVSEPEEEDDAVALDVRKLKLDTAAVKDLVRTPGVLSAKKLIDADLASRYREIGHLIGAAVPAPPARAELDTAHAVDWDSSPTVYQAVSIAHGHLLHFKQVWRADGYSLGDLLYSLPLAPLQKKQIVVIDFDRREQAAKTQMLEEEEALQNLLTRDRDIGEVVSSVLAESMRASSSSSNWGVGGGMGAAGSGSLGVFSVGAVLGFSAGGGGAKTNASQDSSRNLSASSLQQLRDRTQQASSAVRSQRATVVQTTRQGEALSVQSEVVANHNHCHAVTVEYFEVLRHLQVSQELADVQECLFVPLPMSRFDAAKARRWRESLTTSLRDRRLMPAFDAVERRETAYAGTDLPAGRFADEPMRWIDGELRVRFKLVRPQDKEEQNVVEASRRLDTALWAFFAPFLWLGLTELESQYFTGRVQVERDRIFHAEIAPRIAEAFVDKLKFSLVGATGSQNIPLDATLVSEYRAGADLYISLRPAGDLGSLPARAAVERVEIRTSTPLPPDSKATLMTGSMRYRTRHMSHFLFRDWRIENDLMPGDDVQIPTDLDSEELRNPHAEDLRLEQQLLAHLNEHFEYYHKAIWWQMDPDRRFMLLDGFVAPNAGGRSVASVVENRLIGIIGNSLVLPVARGFHLDPTYAQDGDKPIDLLAHYAPSTPIPPMRISLPTRGVFAEAVMGSCNSCEEKDETRFWRFEESPNPDNPTPILPVSTESRRAEPPNLDPTPLPAPLVQIQGPPAAPDPSGLAAALQAIGRPDLFRDITGVEGTQKNAIAAMQSAMESARYYAGEASKLAQSAQQTDSIDKTLQTIDRAQASGALTPEEAKAYKKQAIQRMVGGGDAPSNEDLSAIKDATDQQSVDPASGKETLLEALRKRAGLDPSPTGDVTAAIGRRVASGDGDQISVSDGTGGAVSFMRAAFSLDESAAEGGSGGAGGTGTPATPPVPLFPTAPPALLSANTKLQTGLSAAVGALESKLGIAGGALRMPVAIIDISGAAGTGAPFAAYRPDQMDYIASEAKVPVMYAAYALRDMVRRFAPVSGATDQASLFAELRSKVDPFIRKEVKRIRDATNINDAHRVPKYEALLKASVSGTTWTIDFTSAFVNSLDKMIIPSNNTHAARCVQGVGYGYMNGAFAAGGFFDDTAGGLWEAGDFLEQPYPAGMTKYPYVRVQSVNDGPVAQAGTVRQMARLLALIDTGQIIDAASCTEMATRMHEAAIGRAGLAFDPPFIGRPSPNIVKKASIVRNKIGLGPLKTGTEVLSEVTVLDAPRKPGFRYVVAWQNMINGGTIGLADLAKLVDDTIKAYE